MEKLRKFVVDGEFVEVRLDKFLANQMPLLSRTQIQSLIQDEFVLVNDEASKSSYLVKENDYIIVKEKQVVSTVIQPQKIDIEVVYEDEDMLVVNKQQGMVVHPGLKNTDNTLVNALLYKYDDLSSINGENRRGIVHRLDKDTSGLIIVAKNDYSHKFLADQFKNRTATRVYVALVHGVVIEEKGIIKIALGRDPKNRIKKAPLISGKEAITHFSVLSRFDKFTLIECRLETGRTHQIRVHMAYINHPVAGDTIYGFKKTLPGKGQYLHAKKLVVKHPKSKEDVTFETELPDYFLKTIEELKKG